MSSSAMEQLYQQLIIEHAKDPHGKGLAEPYDAESFQVNPTCGDEVRLRVHLSAGDTAPVIERVSWDGQGCSISQASISVMTELVEGHPVADADELGEDFRALMHARGEGLDETVEDRLGDATAFTGVGRYPARIKCALLGWMALRDALVQAGAGKEDA
jgi:nitrogen fixation NifU-like protein